MENPDFYIPVWTVLFLTVFQWGYAQQQSVVQPTGRADSLREDLTLLRRTLEDRYPSLYRFSKKQSIDNLFDSSYQSITDQTSMLHFFGLLKHLCSALEDGHLYCGPSAGLRSYIDNQAGLFPVGLYFTGQQAYVRYDYREVLKAGTRIISINEVPVEEIRKKLFTYMVSDGAIQTRKYWMINSVFRYYYLFAYGTCDAFDIGYTTPAGVLKHVTIEAKKGQEIAAVREAADHLPDITYQPDGVAILRIGSFDSTAMEDAGLDFRDFIRQSFRDIHERQVKALIIDVRGNGGGRDLYGAFLYSYLAAKPFRYYERLETATTILPYDQLQQNNSSYSDLQPALLERTGEHQFVLKKQAHANLQVIQPAANHYSGAVWFLTDGGSFSTTVEFCAIARSNRRGSFVGEETGGAYVGSTSGVQQIVQLPNTGCSISFGLVKYIMAVKPQSAMNRGIMPDYPVTPSITDVLQGKDVQLQYAIQLAAHSIH